MNVFSHVTAATLKRNRLRTTVTIVGILLSAAMFTAITTICSSLFNHMEKTYIYDSGSWHITVSDADTELVSKISADKRIETLSLTEYKGFAPLEGENFDLPYAYISGVDSNFLEIMPVHILRGRLPENENEIIVPQNYDELLDTRQELDAALVLRVGDRTYNGAILKQSNMYTDGELFSPYEESERVYTVVGVYETPFFASYLDPGYTMLTLCEPEIPEMCYIKLTSPHSNLDDFLAEYLNDSRYSYETNDRVLMFSGIIPYDNIASELYVFVIVFVLIIMLGSVSLIYSTFSISVNERTKQFGLLSSAGATGRQLRSCVMYEAGMLSLCGIPAGILCGIGGIGITLAALGDKFNHLFQSPFPLTLSVSGVAVAAAALLSLFTVFISAMIPAGRATRVSAIDAIRQSSEIKNDAISSKPAPVTFKLFGLEGVLAKKYYRRSRRKYRVTVISLIMSFVLFVTASAFCDFITVSYDANISESDYDLVYYGGTAAKLSDLQEKLEKLEGLTAFSYSKSRYHTAVITKEQYDNSYIDYRKKHAERSDVYDFEVPESNRIYVQELFIDDINWNLLAASAGIPAYTAGDPAPDAILRDEINTAAYYLIDNAYERIAYKYSLLNPDVNSIDIFISGETPEGYTQGSLVEGDDGYVWRYMPENHGELTNVASLDVPAIAEQRRIAGRTGEDVLTMNNGANIMLIYPLSAAAPGGNVAVELYMQTDELLHEDVINGLNEIFQEAGMNIGDTYFYDLTKAERERRNILLVTNVFSYGFIILISLISAANVFNTITTNISLRRRDFAMLKSIGMTGRGRLRMMNFECLLYGTRALLFGIPISLLISFVIFKSAQMSTYADYTPPWAALGIASLSIFVVVFASMIYSMKKIKRDNPIDALKNENT